MFIIISIVAIILLIILSVLLYFYLTRPIISAIPDTSSTTVVNISSITNFHRRGNTNATDKRSNTHQCHRHHF